MADEINIDKGIYLDLDSLLDTRFSLLTNINKNFIDLYFKQDTTYYDERLMNEFSYINYKLFNRLYSRRNKAVLKHAYITNIVNILVAELDLLIGKKLDSGVNPRTKITLNIYPYKITDEEAIKIKNNLYKYIQSEFADIELINIKPSDLTLNYVDLNYNVMFMYSGIEWLDYQLTYNKTSASDTKLYVPMLLFKPLVFKTAKDLEKTINNRDSLLKLYIDITTIDIEHFNILKSIKKKIKENIT